MANKFLKSNVPCSCSLSGLRGPNLEFLDSKLFLGQFMEAYLSVREILDLYFFVDKLGCLVVLLITWLQKECAKTDF